MSSIHDEDIDGSEIYGDDLFDKIDIDHDIRDEEDYENTEEVKNDDDSSPKLSSFYEGVDPLTIVDTGSSEFYNKERTSEVTGKTVINYVDNDVFCNAVIKWNNDCKAAVEAGKPKPPMPDIIGLQILRIAEGLSQRYNFRNYTYIDEMKEDAIYMAVRAAKNFDPEKSTNAFGYFNFVMWRAMTTRIKLEKEEFEGKMSMLKDPMYLGYTPETADDNSANKDRIVNLYEQ